MCCCHGNVIKYKQALKSGFVYFQRNVVVRFSLQICMEQVRRQRMKMMMIMMMMMMMMIPKLDENTVQEAISALCLWIQDMKKEVFILIWRDCRSLADTSS